MYLVLRSHQLEDLILGRFWEADDLLEAGGGLVSVFLSLTLSVDAQLGLVEDACLVSELLVCPQDS